MVVTLVVKSEILEDSSSSCDQMATTPNLRGIDEGLLGLDEDLLGWKFFLLFCYQGSSASKAVYQCWLLPSA